MNKLLSVAATDREAETEGRWFTFTVDAENSFRVKIRRAGTTNAAFMKRQEELMRPYRDAGVDSNRIDSEKQREIAREIYATTVVSDWNADDFGQPFTHPNCRETMAQSAEFQDWIVGKANTAHDFRRAAIEATAGN